MRVGVHNQMQPLAALPCPMTTYRIDRSITSTCQYNLNSNDTRAAQILLAASRYAM